MQVMPPEAPQPGGVFRKVVSFTGCAGRLKKQFFFLGGGVLPLTYWIDLSKQKNVFIYFWYLVDQKTHSFSQWK